jgi:hypothetical protein
MAKKQKHPFLFFGHEPGDWAEGAQLWFLRFVATPTDEDRARLGEVAGELLHGKPLAIESLLFAREGPWAALFSEDNDEQPFAVAGKLFLAFHELAPIAEVILATAREPGYSGWDSWTAKQQALPSVFSGVRLPSGDEHTRIDTHFRTRGTDDDYPARCEAEPVIAVEASESFDRAYRTKAEACFWPRWRACWPRPRGVASPRFCRFAPGWAGRPSSASKRPTRSAPTTVSAAPPTAGWSLHCRWRTTKPGSQSWILARMRPG